MLRLLIALSFFYVLHVTNACIVSVYFGEEKCQVIKGEESFTSPTYIIKANQAPKVDSALCNALLNANLTELGKGVEFRNAQVPLAGNYSILVLEIESSEHPYVFHMSNALDFIIVSRGEKLENGKIVDDQFVKVIQSPSTHSHVRRILKQ